MKDANRGLLAIVMLTIALLLPSSAMHAVPGPPCTISVDGSGGITITPPGCPYSGPGDLAHAPGTTIVWSAVHKDFMNVKMVPGGGLGGTIDLFSSTIELHLTGVGELEGYSRVLALPADCEAHAAPWELGEDPFSFDTEMVHIQAQLQDDPDFALLQIVAGSGFGFPSPGHTTVTPEGGGRYTVESTFDIGFQIEFIGAAGGPLDGLQETIEGIATMQAFGALGVFADGFETGDTAGWD